MKIVIISPYPPYRGGIVGVTTGLEKALREKGHEVAVVSFKRLYPLKRFEKLDAGIDHPHRWIDSLNPYTWLRACDQIIHERPDMVLFAWWHPYFAPCFGCMARLLRRGAYIRIIVLAHNIVPHEWFPFSRSLTKWFFKSVDSFVVMSDAVEKDLLAMVPNAWTDVL